MDELCRLCSSKNELMNVFDTRIGGDIRDLIKIASGIEILETDEISQKVCFQCCSISSKIYQFRQRSSKNHHELMEAHNKRKQIILSRIISHKKDNDDSNNTKSNKISRNCYVENKEKSMKFHPSIIQMKKEYPNIKFPPLQPDSHFQPYITLLTNEVSEYQKKNSKKDAIFRVGLKNVEEPKTFRSEACSSTQNTDIDVNQVKNKSRNETEEIQRNGQKNEEIESQTVEKQTQNKEDDMKRKKSNENDKNKETVPHKKMKSITQSTNEANCNAKLKTSKDVQTKIDATERDNVTTVEIPKGSSPHVQNEIQPSDGLTVEKQRNEVIETKKMEENRSQSTVTQNKNKEIPKKTVEFLQKKKENEIIQEKSKNENANHRAIELLGTISKENYSNTVQKVANKNVVTSDTKLAEVQKNELRPASPKKRSADVIQSSSSKKPKMSDEAGQSSPAKLHQKSEKILRKECETSPVRVVLRKLMCGSEPSRNTIENDNLTPSFPERCTTTTKRALFSKGESNVSCSKDMDCQMESGKKIKTNISVIEISPNKTQNNATPMEIASEELSKEPVINFSVLKHVLTEKLKGNTTPENVQETVVNNINKLNNSPNNDQKIDFVKSLNLMPCSEEAAFERYTKNEMLSVRYVKFCCKYCNTHHSSLKSLNQHEKKYHTSCAFCNRQLESIQERKKHMLFYCPERTIKIPKVVLTKVDKQKAIVSKYANAFFPLNSDHKKSSQYSETGKSNENENSVCASADPKPSFNIVNCNGISTINSRNVVTLKDIYNEIKDRTFYTLDTVIENPIDREYYLKDLATEMCFQNIEINLKCGENMRFQYDNSENLPNRNIQNNLWINETVTYPPIRTKKPATHQVAPDQTINIASTEPNNKRTKNVGNEEVSQKLQMAKNLTRNMNNKTPVQSSSISGISPKASNIEPEKLKTGNKAATEQQPSMERNVTESMKTKTLGPLAIVSTLSPKTLNIATETLQPANKTATQQRLSMRKNVTESMKTPVPVPSISGVPPKTSNIVIENLKPGNKTVTQQRPRMGKNVAESMKTKNPVPVSGVPPKTSSIATETLKPGNKAVTQQPPSMGKNVTKSMKTKTPVPVSGVPPKTSNIATETLKPGNKTVTQPRPSMGKNVTETIKNKTPVQSPNISDIPPKTSNIVIENLKKVNKTAPQQRPSMGKNGTGSMENRTVGQTGYSPLGGGTVDKTKVVNMVNGTSVHKSNMEINVPPEIANINRQVTHNMANEQPIQRSNIKNGVPPQRANVEKQLMQNKVNEASTQRVNMKNAVPSQRTNTDKQIVQNKRNGETSTVQRTNMCGISPQQPNMVKQAQNPVNKEPIQRPNVDKRLTEYSVNRMSAESINCSRVHSAVRVRHKASTTDTQRPTHMTNLPVTSQINERPTLQTNPVRSSRPRPPMPVSSTQQPTLLNLTNNIQSSLSPQFFPLFINGQNLILIQPRQQQNLPLPQLQTTSNNSAVGPNRQPSPFSNSSFQIPSTTVQPMQASLPSTSMANSNNVDNQMSSRIRVKDVRELL